MCSVHLVKPQNTLVYFHQKINLSLLEAELSRWRDLCTIGWLYCGGEVNFGSGHSEYRRLTKSLCSPHQLASFSDGISASSAWASQVTQGVTASHPSPLLQASSIQLLLFLISYPASIWLRFFQTVYCSLFISWFLFSSLSVFMIS